MSHVAAHSITSEEAALPALSQQLEMYRRMMLIRKMEERLGQVQNAGSLPGPVHFYVGQ